MVNTTTATSVTFISSTEVRAQVPATTAGTYIVYLVNSDGGVAIRVNGISFSATPTWTTGSALTGAVDAAISIQLVATGATTFALASGSSLPSGVALSSSGLLSGTITGITTETTYNFTINATDSELQDSPRAFAFTVTAGDPYFRNTSLLLSANGTNNTQNNTFVDSSTNSFAVTRAGNATQGTFSPYGANWSNYFDGTGDYLNTPLNAAFALGTGDFTLECWIYVTAAFGTTGSGRAALISNRTVASSSTSFVLQHYNGKLYFGTPSTDIFPTGSNTTLSINTWYHVAVTRSSGTVRLFLNGVSDATPVTGDTTNFSDTSAVYVGCDGTYGIPLYPYTGYFSNLRIVKGTAIYTTAFTPPTAPLTAITNTSLLTCQSNRFKDNSTNNFAITKAGDVSVQRFSPFSPGSTYSASTIGGSGYFDGTGDYLTVPYSSAFFLQNSYTIEAWVYPSTVNTWKPIFSISATSTGAFGAVSLVLNSATVYCEVRPTTGGSITSITGGTVVANVWQHVAISVNSTSAKLFLNGIQVGSATFPNFSFTPVGVAIGVNANLYGTSTDIMQGYVSDLRVVKGTAVYTADFTPPTAPLTAVTNTSLLLNFTNAGIVDGAMQNVLETVGDAKISTTQSKFGGSSIYFDGTGDWLSLPNTVSLQPGSGNFTIECWINTGYSSTTTTGCIISQYNTASSSAEWILGIRSGVVYIWLGNTNYTGTATVNNNAWRHIAWVRNGSATNNNSVYVDGVLDRQFTDTTNLTGNGVATYIGAGVFGGPYLGYIDDLRVTKGYARYTANFTPPTTALLTQ